MGSHVVLEAVGNSRYCSVCLRCATPLQAEVCNVLKIILQNNPKCQEKALKIGGMNVLLLVTQTHSEMDMRIKAFSCLSALLRYRNAVPVLAFANAAGLE